MSSDPTMLVQHFRVSGALVELADALAEAAAEVEKSTTWETTMTVASEPATPGAGWEPFGVLPETAAWPAQIVWRRRV